MSNINQNTRKQRDPVDRLNIHEECSNQCRSSLLWQHIERYPKALAKKDKYGYLPLHKLLENGSSSIEDALRMIEAYPAALQHQGDDGYFPLHIECLHRCRSSIIAKCIELHPETLAQADDDGYLPLHCLLKNESSSQEDALMMIEAYPAALEHQNFYDSVPLHHECRYQSRSSVLTRLIQIYPEALALADSWGYLPLHRILRNKSSSVDNIRMIVKAHLPALKHRTKDGYLAIHCECLWRCRVEVLRLCIDHHPQSVQSLSQDGKMPLALVVSRAFDDPFRFYDWLPAVIFLNSADRSILPATLLHPQFSKIEYRLSFQDRRELLNLIQDVEAYQPLHEESRKLNWRYRSPMLLLLAAIHSRRSIT